MTDFEAPSDRRPDEKQNGNRKLELSGTQVAASALAAVSSAVAASYLGVAGTVIGAGFGSVVATISTAFYQLSLKRTNETLKKVVPVSTVIVRQSGAHGHGQGDAADVPPLRPVTPATIRGDASGTGPDRADSDPVGSDPVGSDPVGSDPADPDGAGPAGANAPAADRTGELSPAEHQQGGAADQQGGAADGAAAIARRLHWGRLAAAAALVFVVAIGVITLVEAFAGGSLSSVVRGEKRDGTTIGRVVQPDRDTPDVETPAPTSPSAETSGSPTVESPTPESPSTPESSPSAPEPSETVAPSEPPASDEPGSSEVPVAPSSPASTGG
jgi:hypothetical protein